MENKLKTLKSLLTDMNMSAYRFSKITGQNESTIYNWYSGKSKCPEALLWALSSYIGECSKKGAK